MISSTVHLQLLCAFSAHWSKVVQIGNQAAASDVMHEHVISTWVKKSGWHLNDSFHWFGLGIAVDFGFLILCWDGSDLERFSS